MSESSRVFNQRVIDRTVEILKENHLKDAKATHQAEQHDLFIRRAYTHDGITVVVDIDLAKKTMSLVQGDRSGNGFHTKKWEFAGREVKYLAGWRNILHAMEWAMTEAGKVLSIAEDRDTERFAELLMAASIDELEKK